MSLYYSAKKRLKVARWKLRRQSAARRWGSHELNNSPAILGNAMPKSGSHLIIQVLQGLPEIGPAVNPGFPPVNRSEDNRKLGYEHTLENIKRMQPGDIAYGYVHAKNPFTNLLAQSGRATIFVYRDPRDVIVSHVFYATDIHKGHGMHEYYSENLNSIEQRIDAAILGVQEPGYELAPIRSKYKHYLGWLEEGNVLSLKFEDLILDRKSCFELILDYLVKRGFSLQLDRSRAVAILEKAVEPQRSGTYRKAQPGNWREHFTEKNKKNFKQSTGDLLSMLGYELDNTW
jgi:hypothetical protein